MRRESHLAAKNLPHGLVNNVSRSHDGPESVSPGRRRRGRTWRGLRRRPCRDTGDGVRLVPSGGGKGTAGGTDYHFEIIATAQTHPASTRDERVYDGGRPTREFRIR